MRACIRADHLGVISLWGCGVCFFNQRAAFYISTHVLNTVRPLQVTLCAQDQRGLTHTARIANIEQNEKGVDVKGYYICGTRCLSLKCSVKHLETIIHQIYNNVTISMVLQGCQH